MIHTDLSTQDLINLALKRQEATLASNSALRVTTGVRTGRSPRDRFIVNDFENNPHIDWGTINQPYSEQKFNQLWQKVSAYLEGREHFISHLKVGASQQHYLPVTVITEHAWQNLFARQLFIREAADVNSEHPNWTLISAPNYQANPQQDCTNSEAVIIINFAKHQVLICGTHYAGEIKKAMFSVLNYLLPEHDVLPMHCSANVGKNNDVALFFGLSGTGKTTLSADPNRQLIGDDEHGWDENGVFNFEGGCYAKCVNLSEKNEPLIYHAIKHGAIMENVVLDSNNTPNYADDSITENTRAAYPREHIENCIASNSGPIPNNVILLTCDLFGVLPPIAKLNAEQAAYYFISGYTALIGSTEVNSSACIKPTFSHCFGAPFFPRPANVYADLLVKRIKQSATNVYLVNTGWTGGAYGNGGKRFEIPVTRKIIDAILEGHAKGSTYTVLPHFNLAIPTELENVDPNILNPRNTWKQPELYDEAALHLINLFNENFQRYNTSSSISQAAPKFSDHFIR